MLSCLPWENVGPHERKISGFEIMIQCLTCIDAALNGYSTPLTDAVLMPARLRLPHITETQLWEQ